MNRLTKIIILIFSVGAFGYFAFQVFGSTLISKTLDRGTTSLESGLIAHWTLDGTDLISNAVDSSGSANTGYLKGFTSTTTAPGKIGQSLEFDGSNDYVDIPNIAIPQDFTVTAWVNSSMSANDDIIIGSGATAAGNTEAHFGYNNGNEIRYFDVDLSPDTASVSISTAEYKNTWKYITLTKEGSTTKIYSDGYLLNTTVQTGTSLKSFTYLGVTTNNPSGATQRMHGKMDDVRVYNRALSDEEINRLYHLGATTKIATTIKSSASSLETGLVGHWTLDGKNLINNITDSSGQGNNGVLTGNTATTTKAGKLGQALLLDGGTVVNMGDPANGSLDFGTNSFSYGLWVYATSSKGSFDTPISKGGSSAGTNGYDMELGSDAWIVSLADATQTKSGTMSTQPILNKWTHLFAVVDRGTNLLNLYINGVQVYTGVDISTLGDVSGTVNFRLGANISDLYPFLGLIDDARVYNRALSDEEINRLYHLGATTKIATTIKSSASSLETGLVGHWTLDGKNLINNITDSSGQGNNGVLTGNTATTTKAGKLGQALLLDGGTVVNMGDPANGSLDFGTNSFSYGLWVYATSSKGGSDMPINKGGSSAGTNGYDMELGSGAWNASLADATQTKSGQFSTQPILNKWTHLFVVVNRNTNIWKIYVDSTPVNTGGDISTLGDVSSEHRFRLGAGVSDTNPFLGLIDDARVYNRALSDEEVQRLYAMGR